MTFVGKKSVDFTLISSFPISQHNWHYLNVFIIIEGKQRPLTKFLNFFFFGLFQTKGVLKLNIIYVLCCASSLSRVWLFVTPWTVAHQAHLFMGILQAKILEWVAMPSSRGIFPTQGLNLVLLHYRWIFYQLSYHKSLITLYIYIIIIKLFYYKILLLNYLLLKSFYLNIIYII